ncbi:MAG: O-antigen ligase family protein [Rikenellaceae bacterium]
MLPCLLWGYRTSLLANAVMLSIFAIFIFKTRALLAIGLTFGLGVSIIFFTPSIKEKMFFDSQQVTIKDFKEGRISVEQINSNGRFNTWGKLLNRYYKNHKILGSGTGTTQGSMQINKSFGGLTVPHNDYVTLLCDNGLLGLILYLSSFITIIWQCFRKFNNIQSSTEIRFCAIIAGSTLSAIITAMFTENIINYSIATLTIPFVFYGIMMGLSWGKNHNDDFDNYSSL